MSLEVEVQIRDMQERYRILNMYDLVVSVTNHLLNDVILNFQMVFRGETFHMLIIKN